MKHHQMLQYLVVESEKVRDDLPMVRGAKKDEETYCSEPIIAGSRCCRHCIGGHRSRSTRDDEKEA